MKTPPRPGELTLTHITTLSGHSQSFGVNARNFNPEIIRQTAAMTARPVMGYRLEAEPQPAFGYKAGVSFTVCREDGTRLTHNLATRLGDVITLQTSIEFPMPPHEAEMLADLEQCAALALLEITPI
jgi:hypothetical protein